MATLRVAIDAQGAKQGAREYARSADDIRAKSRAMGRDVGQADRQVSRLGESFQRASTRIRNFGLGLTAAVTTPLALASKSMVRLAIDLEDIENLFRISMGSMRSEAQRFIDTLEQGLGLDPVEIKLQVSTIQNMTRALGFSEQAALKMSEATVLLAQDMASALPQVRTVEDALLKLQSGLTGEVEPLKRLGVVLKETAVEAFALREGIIDQNEEMTEQQKVLARLLLVYESFESIQGDLARTLESPENQLRILTAQFTILRREVGELLLPTFNNTVQFMLRAVRVFRDLSDETKAFTVQVGLGVAALGPLLIVMSLLMKFIRPWTILATSIAAVGLVAVEIASAWEKVGPQLERVWIALVNTAQDQFTRLANSIFSTNFDIAEDAAMQWGGMFDGVIPQWLQSKEAMVGALGVIGATVLTQAGRIARLLKFGVLGGVFAAIASQWVEEDAQVMAGAIGVIGGLLLSQAGSLARLLRFGPLGLVFGGILATWQVDWRKLLDATKTFFDTELKPALEQAGREIQETIGPMFEPIAQDIAKSMDKITKPFRAEEQITLESFSRPSPSERALRERLGTQEEQVSVMGRLEGEARALGETVDRMTERFREQTEVMREQQPVIERQRQGVIQLEQSFRDMQQRQIQRQSAISRSPESLAAVTVAPELRLPSQQRDIQSRSFETFTREVREFQQAVEEAATEVEVLKREFQLGEPLVLPEESGLRELAADLSRVQEALEGTISRQGQDLPFLLGQSLDQIANRFREALPELQDLIEQAQASLREGFVPPNLNDINTFANSVLVAFRSLRDQLPNEVQKTGDAVFQEFNALSRRVIAINAELSNELVGQSIWPDMLDTMVRQTQGAVVDIEASFAELKNSQQTVLEFARPIETEMVRTSEAVGTLGEESRRLFEIVAEESSSLRFLRDRLGELKDAAAELGRVDLAKDFENLGQDLIDQIKGLKDELKEGLEDEAKSFEINLGQEIARGVRSITEGLLLGTREGINILEDFKRIGVSIVADMFGQMIQSKLDFDFEMEKNFLTDLPGFLEEFARKGGAIFEKLFDAIFTNKGQAEGSFTALARSLSPTGQQGTAFALPQGVQGPVVPISAVQGPRAPLTTGQILARGAQGAAGAGIGFGIGSLLGNFLPGQTGAQIGGAIGGAAGSFVPIPGASFLGSAFGSLAGSGIQTGFESGPLGKAVTAATLAVGPLGLALTPFLNLFGLFGGKPDKTKIASATLPLSQRETAATPGRFFEDIPGLETPFGFTGLATQFTENTPREFTQGVAKMLQSIDEFIAEQLLPAEVEKVRRAVEQQGGITGSQFRFRDFDSEAFGIVAERVNDILNLLVDEEIRRTTVQRTGGAGPFEGIAAVFEGVGQDRERLLQNVAAFLQARREFERALGDFGDDVTGAEQAIRRINDEFKRLSEQAFNLGFALERVEAARVDAIRQLATDFSTEIERQILGFTDPLQARLEEIAEEEQRRLREARAINAELRRLGLEDALLDLARIERLALLERQDALEQSLQRGTNSIRDFLRNLVAGPDSPLAPETVLTNARQALDRALEQAMTGTAPGNLAEIAGNFLDALQAVEASSERFFEGFQFVGRSLNQLLPSDQQVPGFQHGGSITVPGSGAADSRLLQARVSPGERIDFIPAGSQGSTQVIEAIQEDTKETALLRREVMELRALMSTIVDDNARLRTELRRVLARRD